MYIYLKFKFENGWWDYCKFSFYYVRFFFGDIILVNLFVFYVVFFNLFLVYFKVLKSFKNSSYDVFRMCLRLLI